MVVNQKRPAKTRELLPEDVMLAEKIREYRKLRGLTQEELSNQVTNVKHPFL